MMWRCACGAGAVLVACWGLLLVFGSTRMLLSKAVEWLEADAEQGQPPVHPSAVQAHLVPVRTRLYLMCGTMRLCMYGRLTFGWCLLCMLCPSGTSVHRQLPCALLSIETLKNPALAFVPAESMCKLTGRCIQTDCLEL